MANCTMCTRFGDCPWYDTYLTPCDTCTFHFQFELKKPQTNADRIRAMTGKELAMFLCANMKCEHCKASEFCYEGHIGWIDWLKQECVDG